MSEVAKYEAYKKKLQGICDENNLVYRFRHDTYPITLTIRPVSGVEEQLSLLEAAEDNGYTSPDASIVFAYKDGVLIYKISETFTIGDALFAKIKNLFNKLHYCWLQYFFRDIIERGVLTPGTMPEIDEDDADDLPEDAEQLEAYEDDSLDDDDDNLLDDADRELRQAILIVRAENKASTALLQRRMNIGASRASQLIDQMENLGIVGPFNGAQPREVLPCDVPDDSYEGSVGKEG